MIPILQMGRLSPREGGGLARKTGWPRVTLSPALFPCSCSCPEGSQWVTILVHPHCTRLVSSRKPPRRRPHIQNPPE